MDSLTKKLPTGRIDDMSIHARVAYAMKERRLTREALEDAMGYSTGYMSRFLAHKKEPRLEAILLLATHLRVHLDWLLLGIGPMDTAGETVGEIYAMLPGWAEASLEASAQPRWRELGGAIRVVGRRGVLVAPEKVTPEFVVACARFWLDHASEADLAAVR